MGPARTQVSLEPAAAGGVHDQLALGQGDPGQAAGEHPHPLAVVDRERPQVDVPGTEPAVHEGRHRRQLHDGLGDPGARVVEHLGAELVELGPGGDRADDDALAARPVDRLEHELVEPVEDLLARLRLAHPPGVDVADHRVLGQVVADQVRHVGVDELVVGHAVADRVGERDVAGPRRVDQPRAPEHRVGQEVHRVEELVVDPAVDHVHRLEALGGPHHHPAAAALEVATLDQLDAHGAREEGVLEVRAVVDTGRQHHDRRVGDAGGCRGPQCGEQPLRVRRDGTDPVLRDGLGQRRGDRPAVGHDVGDAGRHPHVVLEHPELALVVADQVDPGDVHAHPVRGADVGRGAVVVGRRRDHLAGDHAVEEHLPGVVHVGQEQLERLHPLLDAAVDRGPGVHLDDPRQDVERERPLLAADVEGDALVEVARLQRLDPTDQVRGGHRVERGAQPPVGRAQVLAVEHLVVRRSARAVALEHGVHVRTLQRPGLGVVSGT